MPYAFIYDLINVLRNLGGSFTLLKNSIKVIYWAILTILTVLSLNGCLGCDGDGGVASTCGDSEAVYVRMDADDSNPGTISEPLKTIQAAVACAVPGQDIRVATGTYETNFDQRIILKEGISIYGGFSSDFQVRDPDVYPTIITDVTDPSMIDANVEVATVVTDNNTTTSATVLDGFTINGPDQASGSVKVLSISGSPTISNNIINGQGSSGTALSSTVIFIDGSPIIKNNIIDSGAAWTITIGIEGSSDGAVISNNTIKTCCADNTIAIEIECAANVSTISHNKITVDSSYGSVGIGVSADSANATITIEANTIKVSSGISSGWAIGSSGVGQSIIRNNVLEGGPNGIHSSSNSQIINNTIVGGWAGYKGIYVYGNTAPPIIQNNIIDLTTGTCIYEATSSLDPLSVKNNDLTGCTTLYVDDGVIEISDIAGVNALSDTDASGNISIPPNLDSAQDYRLTSTSPVEVRQGGLDLSSDFVTDIEGNTRTVPWSMGAYEYD